MKKLLPALLVLLLAFASCKKDAPPASNPTTPTSTTGQAPAQVTVSGISPSSGDAGTVVTISGTNFGTSTTGVVVSFNGVTGTIQSVTATEIKVVVPVTTSGTVTVTVGSQTITGPMFTFVPAFLAAPYVSGDVTLKTQAEVDAFVAINKGKQLQITGNLNIGVPNFYDNQTNDITSVAGLSNITSVSGRIFFNKINVTEASFLNAITAVGGIYISSGGFTSLSFNNLKSFSGSFIIEYLSNLTHVSINALTNVAEVRFTSCPLVTDLSFLNSVTSANRIDLSGLGVNSITMDNLTSLTGNSTIIFGISINNNNSLTKVSFKSLKTIVPPSLIVGNSISITNCPLLSNLDFSSLTSVGGKIMLSGINIIDLNAFSSLQSLGAIQITGNPALASLHGLEHLTSLTMPALSTQLFTGTVFNGIYITNNAKLSTLSGLQNITSVPLASITGNVLLNDFCPLKVPIIALSQLPAYPYTYRNTSDMNVQTSQPALTLTNNGNYATTQDALAAVALCK